MDAVEDVTGGSVSASNNHQAVGGGEILGPSPPLASSENPREMVSEGLTTGTVTTRALPGLPTVSVSAPVMISRPSAKNHISPSLLRGPIPQKGSGQDRFRQLLEGSNRSCLPTVVQSNLFSLAPGVIQRPTAAQRYSPTATDPPPFTLRTATPVYPDGQAMDRHIATASVNVAGTAPAVKTELKESSLMVPKPTTGEACAQLACQPMSAEANAQNPPLATARLSAQCQLRHFNPKWHESSGPNGFKCSVQLINKVIHGGHAYPTAYSAKQAVAEKALVYVRHLPCEDPAQKVAARIKSSGKTDRFSERNRPQAKSEPIRNAAHASFHAAYANAAPAAANAAPYGWNAYNHNEQTHLLHRIQSVFGGTNPNSAVLSDPLAAQAFLQGLAVGTSMRVASSVYDPYLESRGRPLPTISDEVYRPLEARERSPRSSCDRNYRVRSPSRSRRRTSYDPEIQRSD